MPRCRVASKMAALTIVGTAYSAYTGVCNLYVDAARAVARMRRSRKEDVNVNDSPERDAGERILARHSDSPRLERRRLRAR